MNLRSPGATKIVGALALLVLAALGWLLVLGPKTTALADTRDKVDEARAQSDTLRQQLVTLEKQEEQLPQTRKVAKGLAAKFPPTADQPGLFESVTKAATEAGIPPRKVVALTPTPPVVGEADAESGVQLPDEATSGDLASQTVTVSVEGTYDQTRQMLDNLEQMPRAYLVTDVTLSAGTEAAFTTTVTGDMFVMPPAADPATASTDE